MNTSLRHAGKVALQVLMLAWLGGCAPASSGQHAPAPQPQNVLVQVNNQNWEDVAIYLVRGSTPVRLGTVGSMESRTFAPPPALVVPGAELRLLAETTISRRAHTSQAFSVSAGQRIHWRVETHLPLSSVRVR